MFNFFRKKEYQHSVTYSYTSGFMSTRTVTKYTGTDTIKAEETFNKGKDNLNVLDVVWYRDGKQYRKH